MSRNKYQISKSRNLNPKSKYLNSKQILISQFSKFQTYWFRTAGFRIWDLFRISDFGFRISASVILFWILVFGFWIFSYGQEDFIYDAKGRRNPFIPLVTSDGRILKLDKEEQGTDLSLEGISYDLYGLSYAIVNGQIVKVGDKIGDYQVLKIEKNKVLFIKEGSVTEIELKKEVGGQMKP